MNRRQAKKTDRNVESFGITTLNHGFWKEYKALWIKRLRAKALKNWRKRRKWFWIAELKGDKA